MPKRDIAHDAARKALQSDGWVITHDPLVLVFGRRNLFVDLAAEAPLAAEKDGRRIAVEVKTFAGRSAVPEWERAVGQYIFYSYILRSDDPQRQLFLAVDTDIHGGFLSEPTIQDFVAEYKIKLMVFDRAKETIARWIE